MDYNNRILIKISAYHEKRNGKKNHNSQLTDLYYYFGNSLTGFHGMPHFRDFHDYCSINHPELSAFLAKTCKGLETSSTTYIAGEPINSFVNLLGSSEKKKIRITILFGEENDIDNLKMDESTHNMILQSTKSTTSFFAATKHKNAPNFFQKCSSVEDALCYIEALVIDACMCHYIGVSDAALHHDDKQRISQEKVLFLRDFSQTAAFQELENASKRAIQEIVEPKLIEDTPYISFFSIFTLAIKDLKENKRDEMRQFDLYGFFADYCKLWLCFQRWYYLRHQKMIIVGEELVNPKDYIFYRNPYHGQISQDEVIDKILKAENDYLQRNPSEYPLGYLNRYVFVILRNLPSSSERLKICEALFPGGIHQAIWTIIHWSDIRKFDDIRDCIEIVPFLIGEKLN